jgi:hypothetical protein
MLNELSKLSEGLSAHPLLVIVLAMVAAAIVFTGLLLLTPASLQPIRKLAYLTANAFVVDVGWRDLAYWAIVGGVVAVPTAVLKGWGKEGEGFHWGTFWFVALILAGAQAAGAIFHLLTKGGRLLRPVHGAVWRQERKSATAAIIERINEQLGADTVDVEKVRATITDVLRVIAIHVRDHRGDHRRLRVFANLLLPDGDDLVVVARDPTLHTEHYHRDIPKRYKKALLAAGRAFDGKAAVSVGELTVQYPEGPKNKPYASILALPLFGSSTGNTPIGVVSIDCSRPYFFETFAPGAIENELENNLAPYLRTLVLVLESLLSRDPRVMLSKLTEMATAPT